MTSDGYNEDSLELMKEDTAKVLEQLLQKHGDLQKKAVQIIQVNGLVISLLIAGSSRIVLNGLLLMGGLLLLASTLVAGYALRGTSVNIGIGVDQIKANMNENLDKQQYLIWYLRVYYPQAFKDLNNKTANRGKRVRYSLYAFLAGIVLVVGGIVIKLPQ